VTSVTLTWAELFQGLESELTNIEHMARRVDETMMAALILGEKLSDDQATVLQEMDVLIQTVEDLRNFSAHLKTDMATCQIIEIASALEVLRLARVRANLSQVKHDKTSDHGQVTIF
jgi:ATP-dependent RNA circularization protein (DNA/RNA ligase family)